MVWCRNDVREGCVSRWVSGQKKWFPAHMGWICILLHVHHSLWFSLQSHPPSYYHHHNHFISASALHQKSALSRILTYPSHMSPSWTISIGNPTRPLSQLIADLEASIHTLSQTSSSIPLALQHIYYTIIIVYYLTHSTNETYSSTNLSPISYSLIQRWCPVSFTVYSTPYPMRMKKPDLKACTTGLKQLTPL